MHLYIFSLLCLFSILQAVQEPIPSPWNSRAKRDTSVSICMMFQNEAPFLHEWITYHKALGIGHFYLYDNASDDDSIEVLKPFVSTGEVELFHCPERTTTARDHDAMKKEAYAHALKLAKGHSRWMAFIDADEFICLPSGERLPIFMNRYKDYPGVVANWVMYGSSGIEELLPGQLQTKSFLYRAPDDWAEHTFVKSIVRISQVKSMGIHRASYKNHQQAVFADYQPFSQRLGPIHLIRINHYWWRSEKYFREVKLPRRAGWLSKYTPEEIIWRRNAYNSVYDPSALY